MVQWLKPIYNVNFKAMYKIKGFRLIQTMNDKDNDNVKLVLL